MSRDTSGDAAPGGAHFYPLSYEVGDQTESWGPCRLDSTRRLFMNRRSSSSRLLLFILLSSLTIATSQGQLKSAVQNDQKAHLSGAATITSVGSLNINNLWLVVGNDGRSGYDSASGGNELTYPLFNGNVLYSDNLLWVGKVDDGALPLIRTGGGTYRAGVRPGAILAKGVAEDPAAASGRVFRYRPDYQTGDLTLDAAALDGVEISKVTPDMIFAVREGYKRDVAEWPWRKGAPFVDKNHNGAMDAGESPGLENASQVLWLSYNDLDETVCRSSFGDPPIGLEVQVTFWAYKGAPYLDDVIFKRYRVIYKGTSLTSSTARIDSMFLTQWSDPDIGDAGDDLGGSDSLLDLTYGYNGTYNGTGQDRVYHLLSIPTPGFGYALLQGPLVPGAGVESGTFNFGRRSGFKNLRMTSSLVHITGVGDGLNDRGTGSRTYFYWKVARGFLPFSNTSYDVDSLWSFGPILDNDNRSTKYMYYGDPVAGTGWLASKPRAGMSGFERGGDSRLFMNTGPFAMALGDTQEVVIAMIASSFWTAADNVTWLRNTAKFIRGIYPNLGEYASDFVSDVSAEANIPAEFSLEQNFPNPFNPSTRIRFTLPAEGQARLTICDILGREIRVLIDGALSAGRHTVVWDGRTSNHEYAPSGVYFYRLIQRERQQSRKLLLLR